jgi:hypothetical protein
LDAPFAVKGLYKIPARPKRLFPFGAVSYLSDSMTAPLFFLNAGSSILRTKESRICGDLKGEEQ